MGLEGFPASFWRIYVFEPSGANQGLCRKKDRHFGMSLTIVTRRQGDYPYMDYLKGPGWNSSHIMTRDATAIKQKVAIED